MNQNSVWIFGNLINDPVLRTEKGVEVAHFRVASTPRRHNRHRAPAAADTVFLGVSCRGALGRNVLASLRNGDPVLLVGRLFITHHQQDGQPRSGYELQATAVGPNLTGGTAVFQPTGGPAATPAATQTAPDRDPHTDRPRQDPA